jgi:type IV pilus biogenesis protein CpaD/CtpE
MPLFITEYRDLARDTGHNHIAAGMEPAIAEQTITVSASSTQSAAFNAQTSFVMVHAQEATCLKWGTNPTAVTSAQRMAAGETRYVGVPPGKSFKVAAIAGV